eukprot:GHRQ01026053.1.p1 GENE.GHRQ01026053.1~~GHRQ01026053.1.p1  ORF type:complete len:149 (+),score=53.12 GHRQ01026053.1:646-1092(+)
MERCVRFFGAFAAKTPANDEAAAAVVEELLTHLAGHLSALDKTVRYRSAQLLQQLLAGVPASLLLEDSVAELLRESLQDRLQDKQPVVRAEACRALGHLVSGDEVSKQVGLYILPKPIDTFLCTSNDWTATGDQVAAQQQTYWPLAEH